MEIRWFGRGYFFILISMESKWPVNFPVCVETEDPGHGRFPALNLSGAIRPAHTDRRKRPGLFAARLHPKRGPRRGSAHLYPLCKIFRGWRDQQQCWPVGHSSCSRFHLCSQGRGCHCMVFCICVMKILARFCLPFLLSVCRLGR